MQVVWIILAGLTILAILLLILALILPKHYSVSVLEKLEIPVLVSYGTRDWAAPYNDLLRVNIIRKRKSNFSFLAYIELEHNYFQLTPDNKPDYNSYNWDKVTNDWLNWLERN